MTGREQHDDIDAEAAEPPRERPWLLPYNRRLRHLQGLTIRNLTLAAPGTRSRTRTIDDDGVPSSLKTPTKTLALQEGRGLTHSRSSSDLQSKGDVRRHHKGKSKAPETLANLNRPAAGKTVRRRSTMEWSGASPETRQRRLEDITESRMADTFFSLHVDHLEDPIYVSEVVEKAMNPNFRFFDIGSCGPDVTRLDKLTVKVWARNKNTQGWQYLIEFTVQLRALQFIGRTLGGFKHPLPQNCILFHMTDGIYTSFTDLPVQERLPSVALAPPKAPADGRVLKTSTYDALMRLSTLDDCIQDALATRDRLAEEIETILNKNREAISTLEQVPEAQDRLKTVEAAVAAEKRRVEAIRRRRDDLRANIDFRKERMEAGTQLECQVGRDLDQERELLQQTNSSIEKTEDDIHGQRRRICEDLLKIFPIEPVMGKPLLFTIRSLPLPNGDFDDADEEKTSAALGYVAQVVSLLSAYLSVLLPYPVTICGSTSTIDDPLAMTTGKQPHPPTYPLFMKGVVRFRFEYGVFLLNKNIEILSNAVEIRPLDIRHTLPNLKYLLYVATAGKGELPERKAGGIRGLLRRDGVLSRTGSVDSTATRSSVGVPEIKFNLTRNADIHSSNGTADHTKQKVITIPGSRLREVS
ncbi:UV radiation resistance-associated gene protein [Westerdykella ornata]|uniref:Autophagy-related protein 14 n=1 Tax=Westerdykella ornata TaxID=318751 RepID=A0A6A6J923_WESOR|nr:UV radiation resistance-associated gene protein [Westerdykella ornata]KAF2272488.1 UV radiation resistance-associated gene protein [Westerdykella ornata]